jgi:hypothetical protein
MTSPFPTGGLSGPRSCPHHRLRPQADRRPCPGGASARRGRQAAGGLPADGLQVGAPLPCCTSTSRAGPGARRRRMADPRPLAGGARPRQWLGLRPRRHRRPHPAGLRRGLPDERVATCAGFLTRAAAWFTGRGVTVRRVLTDNAKCYRVGKARFNRTLQTERAYQPAWKQQHRAQRCLGQLIGALIAIPTPPPARSCPARNPWPRGPFRSPARPSPR